MDDTDIYIDSSSTPTSGNLPASGKNLNPVTFPKTKTFTITSKPKRIIEETSEAAIYKAEISFEAPTVKSITVYVENSLHGIVLEKGLIVRVSLNQFSENGLQYLP